LASSTDRSEDALPRPELNPLLNPLLADNMGRWAEVYFTSAPEKREEAVLDLLRELQARNSEQTNLSEGTQSPLGAATGLPSPGVGTVTQRRLEMQRCNTCGQDNPLRHQFCGMCGAKLGSPASEDYRAAEDFYHSPRVGREHPLDPAYAEPRGLDREPVIEESVVIAEEPARNPYDLSLFQSLREREGPAGFEYGQSPSVRYRYFIGAILAVLIVALGYMAWRGAHANQDAQDTAPAPAPVATDNTPTPAKQNTTSSAPSNPKNNSEPQAASPEQKAAEPADAKPVEVPKQRQTAAVEPKAVPSPTRSAPPIPDSLGQQDSQASGADDFSVAQGYLNGTNGRGRDAAEAAKLLWRAVSKHNGPAMVALADLYLKGNGVSKNCDQARVLLDSAALRGVAGAGQRLRNLQAFGCQ
jgi:hypothetical protein